MLNLYHVDVINGKEYPPSDHYITMGKIEQAKHIFATVEPSVAFYEKGEAR